MVYIDSMNAGFGNMVMCHMVADTSDELKEMAKKIGVNIKWLQYAGTYREHFDICLSKKKLALKAGAREISRRELALLLEYKKQHHGDKTT